MLQTSGDAANYLAPIVVGEETFAVSVNLKPRRAHPQIILVSNINVSAVEGDWTGTSHVVFATGADPSTNSIETRRELLRTAPTGGGDSTEERMVGGTWLDVSDGTPAFPDGKATMSFSYSYAGFVNEWSFTR